MGRLDIVISDELEARIRKKTALGKKGAISKAAEEAFILWLKKSDAK